MEAKRQKTAEELKQEERDAALARQFQEQLDNEQAAAAHVHPTDSEQTTSPPRMENGVMSISCPACTFINTVKEPETGVKYGCKQCRTPLPIPQSMLTPKAGGTANNGKMAICPACGITNRIPQKKADAFLCGGCQRQLVAVKPPVAAQRTVQVRCGQCSAINAVQVSTEASSVQFECGNCETVNEAAL